MFLYAFEESVDCHLLSSFCDDSNLHISLFKYVLSTMGVSKESYTVTFVEKPSCHSLDICENKMVSPNWRANQHSEHDPPPCEIIITTLCVVWLNPMLSSALCASFSLNTACLLPPQRLKRTRDRFKCVSQRLTARTWLTIFLYRC